MVRHSRPVRQLAAITAPLMLAGALAGLAPATSASGATCHSTPGPPPVSPGLTFTQLTAVTTLSACDIWTVGYDDGSSGTADQTLAEHWDGSHWTVVPTPSPGATINFLGGVRAAGPSSVWAVGWFRDDGSGTYHPLVLHWNGTVWIQQDTSALGPGRLRGVRVVSADDVWAVGETTGGAALHTLIARWNGTAWTRVKSPNPGPSDQLFGVAATSHTSAWAVGLSANSIDARGRPGAAGLLAATAGARALILRWNGRTWTTVKTPSSGTGMMLSAVGATSASNAWAVGSIGDSQFSRLTLALHWNGRTWARVATPRPGASGTFSFLDGVFARSATDAWAVGGFSARTGFHTIIAHWNGTAWARMSSPNPGTADNDLLGVASGGGSAIWAVGSFSDGRNAQAMAVFCC